MKRILFALSLPLLFTFISHAQSNEIGAGISLVFDGNPGNYVDLGDVYNNLAFPLLFEAWVKPLDYSAGAAIFSSDNDAATEQGLRVSLTAEGKVKVEFGNGQGSGPAFRRGFVTNWTIPLDSWTHIAVSCKSASLVTIYISGVSRSLSPTDGTSTSEVIGHSAAGAAIGKNSTTAGDLWFHGELDEVRLWKKSRSQLQIRDHVCAKYAVLPSEMIGYWTVDESYSSSTVLDKAGNPEDGTVMGNVGKVLSGAAIGNLQKSKFTSNWFDVKVTLYSPSGDKMLTQEISGDGIIVYCIDAPPVLTDGLQLSPSYYFGVYCIKGTGNAGYNMRYKYNGNNGIVNPENELQIQFMSRKDDTDAPWIDLSGANDTADNWISQHDGVSLRGEYTINIPVTEKLAGDFSATDESIMLFPNPASSQLQVTTEDPLHPITAIRILNSSGMLLRQSDIQPSASVMMDTNSLAEGVYFADITTTSGHTLKKFIVQH